MPSPGNRPRPWAFLLWPFLWVYSAVNAALDAVAEKIPLKWVEPPDLPPSEREPNPRFTFWGREYNLLWSGDQLPHALTIDQNGQRQLYAITEISGVPPWERRTHGYE